MSNILLIGIALCVVWYLSTFWTDTKADAPSPIPSDAPSPIPSVAVVKGKPRRHKYDILLELQECLREAGQDEKKVNEICASIAPLLLGTKHE